MMTEKSPKKISLSENAIKVLEKRYLQKDEKGNLIETPEQMFKRVTHNIALVEKKFAEDKQKIKEAEKKFHNIMATLQFLPNSPTLMNAGTKLQQLSACFVLSVDDSIESIYEAIKHAAIIHKSGGGTGFSFSRIRPKGSPVGTTSGVASGPVSFMKVFDASTEAIKQGGRRRGANMGILNVNHPDIMEFITSKSKEGDLKNFNISVAVSDAFMEAAQKDEDYELVDPRTGQITGKLKASEVLDKIAQMAWQNGEPGVIFLDRINQFNPTPNVGRIESTNPCVTGDTWVATENGLLPVKQLKKGMRIWTLQGLRPISKVFNNGVQDVYLITTKRGFSLKATPDHKLLTPDRGWVEVSELKKGTQVSLSNKFEYSFDKLLPNHFQVMDLRKRTGFLLPLEFVEDYGYMLGILVGNGYYSTATAFYFGQKEKELYLKTKRVLDNWKVPYQTRKRDKTTALELSKSIRRLWRILGASPGKSRSKKVPASIFEAPKPVVRSFLKTIFSCSGSIDNSNAIRLSSASLELLKEVQLLLLGFNIKGKIYTRSRKRKYAFVYTNAKGEEKKYPDRDYYELIITRASREKFADEIGFYLSKKEEKVESRRTGRIVPEVWSDEIKSVKYAGKEEVFDVTEPETLTWITNGFVSLDCGEQPLLPYESCLAPEMRILSDKGWEKIEEAYKRQQRGEKVSVYTDRILKNDVGLDLNPAIIVPVGKRGVVKLELNNGQKLRLTPDHKILTQRGWVPVEKLEKNDFVYIMEGEPKDHLEDTKQSSEVKQKEFYQMLGWLVGDGWHTKKSSGLVFAPKDYKAKERFLPLWQKLALENKTNKADGRIPQGSVAKNGVVTLPTTNTGLREVISTTGLKFANSAEKTVPSSVFSLSPSYQIAFLKGLFAAEGSVNTQRAVVSLTTGSQDLAHDVQLLLLSLGIKSKIYSTNHRDGRSWYNVRINSDGFKKFSKKIGFPLHSLKRQRMKNWIESKIRKHKTPRRMKIKSISPAGSTFVYDVYEPKTHSLIAEGMIVHNCNLGSISLAKMVEEDKINWDKLREVVHNAVHFLDNVIDANKYPLPQIEKNTKANRKVGLGVMGFADLLIKLNIPYNSKKALNLAEKIMAFIQDESKKASQKLAEQRGTFPNFKESLWDKKNLKARNATTTTIAPTGSISMIADCSSGIEPLFSLVYYKEVLEGENLLYVNHDFEKVARERGFYSDELMKKIAEEKGSCQNIPEVPEEVKKVFVTALDIPYQDHIKMQAAFQKNTDNAVSKTINLPNNATRAHIKDAFITAYKLGCKGITVYRDRSREEQVLRTGKVKEKRVPITPYPRPKVTRGITREVRTGCGDLYVTINENKQGEPFEVFAQLGKGGGCAASQTEAIGRLASLALRSGIPWLLIVKQLKDISCDRPWGLGKKRITSCADAVGKAIEMYIEEKVDKPTSLPSQKKETPPGEDKTSERETTYTSEPPGGKVMGACPDCGSSNIEHEGGCYVCRSCGYSECE